jgi:hypothetical protein
LVTNAEDVDRSIPMTDAIDNCRLRGRCRDNVDRVTGCNYLYCKRWRPPQRIPNQLDKKAGLHPDTRTKLYGELRAPRCELECIREREIRQALDRGLDGWRGGLEITKILIEPTKYASVVEAKLHARPMLLIKDLPKVVMQ